MNSKSHDNEVTDDLTLRAAERVRQEALRQLIEFDIDDDDARMEPLPGSAQPTGPSGATTA
jgi:hypothetical protein